MHDLEYCKLPCNHIKICNKYFKLQESRDHRRNLLGALDTRVRHSFKTPGTTHQMTQHHILEDLNSQKINC